MLKVAGAVGTCIEYMRSGISDSVNGQPLVMVMLSRAIFR
jgi:hypothetical protein